MLETFYNDSCGYAVLRTKIKGDAEGMVVTSDREKAAVFTKYFDQLYNPTVNVDRDLLMEIEGESEGEEWVSIADDLRMKVRIIDFGTAITF